MNIQILYCNIYTPLFLNTLIENNFIRIKFPSTSLVYSFFLCCQHWLLMFPASKHKMVCAKCVQVQIFLVWMWPLVWLFSTSCQLLGFSAQKHDLLCSILKDPGLQIYIYLPIYYTYPWWYPGWPLAVCVCVSECAHAPAAYSIHQPSWSVYTLYLVLHPLVIICSIPRSRQSRGKRREGLPAVMLQAKIFVTRSPVAVPSSISQSLSFPLQLPPLSPSRASAHGCCSKR